MRVANVGDYALLNGRSRAALHFRQREQHQHSFCAICALTKDPLQLVLATCRRDAARQARSSPAPLCLGHRRPASFRSGRATLENLRRVDARSSSVGVCLHAHAFQDQPVRAGSSRGHQTPGRHRGAGHAGLAHRQRHQGRSPLPPHPQGAAISASRWHPRRCATSSRNAARSRVSRESSLSIRCGQVL